MRQFRLRSLGALLAVVLSAVTGGVCAAEPASPIEAADLRLVPADAAGIVTLCVAAVADKLGLKEASRPWSSEQLAVGLCRRADDGAGRFTVVFPNMNDEPVSIYRTTKPCDRETVLKALAPDAKSVKRGGKVFHVNAAGAAVHFADDCVFLYGPDKQVADVVAKRGAEGKTHLAVALRKPRSMMSSSGAERPSRMKLPPGPMLRYRVAVGLCMWSSPVIDLLVTARAFFRLSVWPSPLTFPCRRVLEAGDVFLDLGESVVLGAHLNFADEDTARRGAKLVSVGRDAARGLLLMAAAQFAAVESVPGIGRVEPQHRDSSHRLDGPDPAAHDPLFGEIP